jgi:hypothetical protein
MGQTLSEVQYEQIPNITSIQTEGGLEIAESQNDTFVTFLINTTNKAIENYNIQRTEFINQMNTIIYTPEMLDEIINIVKKQRKRKQNKENEYVVFFLVRISLNGKIWKKSVNYIMALTNFNGMK